MSTYTPQDAVNECRVYAHGIPVDTIAANACDQVNGKMWRFYPWSWAQKQFTPFQWINGQQDYIYTGAFITVPVTLGATNYGGGFQIANSPNGLSESGTTVTVNLLYTHNLPLGTTIAGTVATINGAGNTGYNTSLTITNVPTASQIVGTIATSGLGNSGATGNDILRPLHLINCRQDVTPNEFREMRLINNLSPELTWQGGIDTNLSIGWLYGTTFRWFRACVVGTNQLVQFQGYYQYSPAKITNDKMQTAFPFPDEYYEVFTEGLKWKFYSLSDDPRAGTVMAAKNGAVQYSGQLAVFYDALVEMARTEDLSNGDDFEFPEAPLGTGRTFWPGLYQL